MSKEMFKDDDERYLYLKNIGKDNWYCDDVEFMKEYKETKKFKAPHREWRKPTCKNDWRHYPAIKPIKKEFTKEYKDKIKKLPLSEYIKTDWWLYIQNWMRYISNRKCGLCGKSHCILTLYLKSWKGKGEEKVKDLDILCNDCANKKYFNK